MMPGCRYDPARGKFKGFLMVVVRSRLADFWRRGAAELDPLWDEEWRSVMIEAALVRVRGLVSARQIYMAKLRVRRLVEKELRRIEREG